MSSISELKVELQDAKYLLRVAQRVDWGSGGSGMTSYSDCLAVVTRLQSELNKAIKEEAG